MILSIFSHWTGTDCVHNFPIGYSATNSDWFENEKNNKMREMRKVLSERRALMATALNVECRPEHLRLIY